MTIFNKRISHTSQHKLLSLLVIIVMMIGLLISTPVIASDNQASLSIQPNSLEIPLIHTEYGLGRFYIELFVSNVTDLASFKFSIVANGDILSTIPNAEQWGGYWGESTQWSGGGSSSGGVGYGSYTLSHYNLTRPISGSGILLGYWFEPKSIGTTQIQMKDVEFRNSTGALIPVIIKDSIVNVISLDVWLDGQYAMLEADNKMLEVDNKTLKTNYEILSNDHDNLLLTYGTLQSSYELLNSDYKTLNSNYTSIQGSYDLLNSEYLSLESEYADVKLENQSLTQELKTTKERLTSQQIILYSLIGLVVVLICAVAVFIIRAVRSRRSSSP